MLQVKTPISMNVKPPPIPDAMPHDPPNTPQNPVNLPVQETKQAPPPNFNAVSDFVEVPMTLNHVDPTKTHETTITNNTPAHIYEGESHATRPTTTTIKKTISPTPDKKDILYGLQQIEHETIHRGNMHKEQPELHIISERHANHKRGPGWYKIQSIEPHHPRSTDLDELKKTRYQSKHHLKTAVIKKLSDSRKRSHLPFDPHPLKRSLF